MSQVRQIGERGVRYDFRDRDCIARPCFQPGMFQHRGATMGGSRNTGSVTPCCMRRAYHGCPSRADDTHAPNDALERQRKVDGWRNV